MIKEAINKLVKGQDLSQRQAQMVTLEIMSGKVSAACIASFLTALRLKGETADEITGAVKAMRRFAAKVSCSSRVILDTCGTGGDKKGTFNISTISAFVAAGAGITVAKHGNRFVSGTCGSADLLEALGVDINMDRALLKKCLSDVGIAFLFAPNMHPAMKHTLPVRKELGIKTIFNVLGPLSNPACATHQLIGVYDRGLTVVLCKVLKKLGSKRALLVHGKDGLDEITTTAPSYACELRNGSIRPFIIKPQDLGIKRAGLKDLGASSIAANVKAALYILKGGKGPKRDIVLLNAAAAIYVAGKAESIRKGLILAANSIDSGKALSKLQALQAARR